MVKKSSNKRKELACPTHRITCGLELHIQLDTAKLFCPCPSVIHESMPEFVVERRLRAVAGEMGEVDLAAMAEESKDLIFRYEGYSDCVCLVELDEEPPHPINPEALTTALKIALMLKMRIFDEIHVMRKTVVDGSNVSGFQRTALCATGGAIETTHGTVGLATLCLEEDAARKVDPPVHEGSAQNVLTFRLDRLGIPLVEVCTDPDLHDPDQVREAAEIIGLLSRMTGKAKRGIGTIRQDVNVSIEGGNRVEIKGFQELGMISEIVRLEARRQECLLEIRGELRERGVEEIPPGRIIDLSTVFVRVEKGFLRDSLKSKSNAVLALPIRGLGGILGREIGPGRRFGTELADYARIFGGVRGIIHSDEVLSSYGISRTLASSIFTTLHLNSSSDAFALVVGPKEAGERALEAVRQRVNQALRGIPREVRGPRPDCTTHFQRPLPGGARMYPETDHTPIRVSDDELQVIREDLPEMPQEKKARFERDLGMSSELANQILHSRKLFLFDSVARRFPQLSTFIASFLLGLDKEVQNLLPAFSGDELELAPLEDLVSRIAEGKISQSSAPRVLGHMLSTGRDAQTVISELGLLRLDKAEVQKVARDVVEERLDFVRAQKQRALGPLMGVVMDKLQGRADGHLVSEILKEEITRVLGNHENP